MFWLPFPGPLGITKKKKKVLRFLMADCWIWKQTPFSYFWLFLSDLCCGRPLGLHIAYSWRLPGRQKWPKWLLCCCIRHMTFNRPTLSWISMRFVNESETYGFHPPNYLYSLKKNKQTGAQHLCFTGYEKVWNRTSYGKSKSERGFPLPDSHLVSHISSSPGLGVNFC